MKMIIELAKKLRIKATRGKRTLFNFDVAKQRAFLESFPEPKDLIESSYYQYLCQAKQLPFGTRFLQNVGSIFLLPFFFLRNLKFGRTDVRKSSNTGLFISAVNDLSYVPEALKAGLTQIIHIDISSSIRLDTTNLSMLRKIFIRYWSRPYFVFKCMMKIGLYSQQISLYNPRQIITIGEYSFPCSLLTYYCELQGIEHINVMHGEKLFNIRDAFASFHRYYVWDEHYVSLLTQLRQNPNQFVVEMPNNLKLNICSSQNYKYFITYYLGGEDSASLKKIMVTLKKLDCRRNEICIRLHPRYSDRNEVYTIFNGFIIQDPNNVSIERSLSITKFAVSLYSTVLYQAYTCGKPIILDDLTNPENYLKLRELKYILINKPHIRLSDFISNAIKDELRTGLSEGV